MTIRNLLRSFIFASIALLAATTSTAQTTTVLDPLEPVRCTGAGRIQQDGFVPIGGIEQWITIRGERCDNPVILFLHGGPGNAMSPYADAIYGDWAADFTLVQWDQRAAGKTFGRNKPGADTTLTLAQMTADGIEVSNFLRRHLGKRKIILTGSSWGSILGAHMAKQHPELFHAYVGVAQMVERDENLAASFKVLTEMSALAGDKKSSAMLASIGAPPWTNPRNFGIMRRITRQYEAKTTAPAPAPWWKPAPAYATPQALGDAEEADDYSFVQFMGMTGEGMFSQVDLPKLGLDFHLPVFLVHGTEDLVTRVDVTKRYFDRISAPEKAFILVPAAGHDPNQVFIDAQYKVMMERVRPGAK
ncbi:alpha/beta fold hydrolase [Massilia glaciei]|uniref:Proline iminopeptidase n=1 Tax=Massilia glaciei TaxID=1524097 RepID=A0A2U2HEF6_9BURK|nr:alpha/beta hydrolase [Massilia glaciei]PWF42043.1 alpha/beta hydrolase [Massilia glaciei]